MKALIVFFSAVAAVSAIPMFVLDDGEMPLHRVRRDAPPVYTPPANPYPSFKPDGPYDSSNIRPAVAVPAFPVDDVDDVDFASERSSHGYHPKGRVGPVYTFVKTDPYAHVKWGVRHVVGKQYAG